MTTTHTNLRTSIIAVTAALMLAFALLPASPAEADHDLGAGATAGVATLDAGIPSCGDFSFEGVGAALAVDTDDLDDPDFVAAPFVEAEGDYCNLELVTGEADGTLTFSSVVTDLGCDFHWDRVGLIALITFSGVHCHDFGLPANAVAAFVPNPVANADGSVTAAVVGGGIF